MSASNGTAAEGRPDGRQAAAKATERNSVRVPVPVLGTVTLPPPEQLAFVGGIAVLTVLEVMEWPVAVALVAGHVLTARSHNKVVRDFGEALQEALSRPPAPPHPGGMAVGARPRRRGSAPMPRPAVGLPTGVSARRAVARPGRWACRET